ncbi:hypothetical protein D3C73_1501750 [compost metagenome]
MAAASRIDLYGLNAKGSNPVGVLFRSQVPFDDPDAVPVFKSSNGRLQESGFAGARRAHQVDGQCGTLTELLPDKSGSGVIVLQHILVQYDLHGLAPFIR